MTPYEGLWQSLESRRQGATGNGRPGGFKATCPVHGDDHASLSVWKDAAEVIAINCLYGCETRAIVEALGYRLADIHPDSTLHDRQAGRPIPPGVPDPQARPAPNGHDTHVHVEGPRIEYHCTDLSGRRRTQVRIDHPCCGQKRMWWEPPGPGSGDLAYLPIALDPGHKRTFVEGGKAADAMAAAGFPAVGLMGGASATPTEDALRSMGEGARCVLYPDADDAGVGLMGRVGTGLTGIAESIALLDTDPSWPKGWDAADILWPDMDAHTLHRMAVGEVLVSDEERIAAQRRLKAAIEGRIHDFEPNRTEVADHPSYLLRLGDVWADETPIDYVCPDLLALGWVTEFDAKVKTGKTIFLYSLIRAGLTGEAFLGRDVRFDRVLYLSETSPKVIKTQLGVVGLGKDHDSDRLWFIPLYHPDIRGLSWKQRLKVARTIMEPWVAAGERVLLVVDTFSRWANMTEGQESDSGAMGVAYAPLKELATDVNIAIAVLRHAKKGVSTDVSDAARGSSAGSGEADHVYLLTRTEGRQTDERAMRVLRGLGRFPDGIEEARIELEAGIYQMLGDNERYEGERAKRLVLELLGKAGKAVPEGWLVEQTDINRNSIRRALIDLTATNDLRVTREGEGHRGDPFRYRLTGEQPVEDTPPDPSEDLPPEQPGLGI